MSSCAKCGKEATKMCKNCKQVQYCSADCQRGDWKRHKKDCRGGTPSSSSPPSDRVESKTSSIPWTVPTDIPTSDKALTWAEARWIMFDGKTTTQISGKRTCFHIPNELITSADTPEKITDLVSRIARPRLDSCHQGIREDGLVWYCPCGEVSTKVAFVDKGAVLLSRTKSYFYMTQLAIPSCSSQNSACKKKCQVMLDRVKDRRSKSANAALWYGWLYRETPGGEVKTYQTFRHSLLSTEKRTEQEWTRTWVNEVQMQLTGLEIEVARQGVPYACVNCGSREGVRPAFGVDTEQNVAPFQLRTVELQYICSACHTSRFAKQDLDDEFARAVGKGNTCRHCGLFATKEKKLKKCARCQDARYCSAECQTLDWPKHKAVCTLCEVE